MPYREDCIASSKIKRVIQLVAGILGLGSCKAGLMSQNKCNGPLIQFWWQLNHQNHIILFLNLKETNYTFKATHNEQICSLP